MFRSIYLTSILIYICCCAVSGVQAAEQGNPKQVAMDRQLALTDYWLALGHYKKNTLRSGYISRVNDTHFFLATEGRDHPEAELLATIDAALNDYNGDVNEDPLCRFPARYRWLDQQLQLGKIIHRQPDCSEYKKWRQMIDAHSVVLVYASAHLNSPSSMYGHTLLRIDPKSFDKDNAFFLSWAVSFGANIPAGDTSIIYAYKGIFGGYPGIFNVLPYYEKLKEYSRIEHRDIWEYKLNLNEQEVDTLTTHLWELKAINFGYYFFDENCSYRLLELLELARPESKVTTGYPLVVIPVDTVRGVIKAGFVSDVVYRPATATQLEYRIQGLTDDEKKLSLSLSENSNVLSSLEYQAYTPEEKTKVSNVAYDYVRYQLSKPVDNKQALMDTSFRLLKEINTLPSSTLPEVPVPFHPENGHDSGAFSVATGREANQNYLDMEVRLSFHDLLDNMNGYIPGSAINMGKFKFRSKETEGIQLQQLDVIDINSLSPRDNFFKPLSWRSTAGFERQQMRSGDEGVWQVNGGGGVTYPLIGQTLFYTLLTGRAEYNGGFADNWQAAAGAAAGLLRVSPAGSSEFTLDSYEFLNGYHRNQLSLSHNFTLEKDVSLRLMATRHLYSDMDFNTVELSFRKFF